MVPTTTVAASLQGRYEGESSLDLSRSLTLLTVSNRRKVSPTLNRVAMHWAKGGNVITQNRDSVRLYLSLAWTIL